jgi:asparagine synthase (glutamine-hydrolysing)
VPAWMDHKLTSLARSILTRKETLARGWWTADGIDRLLADTALHGFRIYSLLMLELTVRIHIELPVSTAPPTEGLEAFASSV